jgi:mono/diheme cytochrome c family protein
MLRSLARNRRAADHDAGVPARLSHDPHGGMPPLPLAGEQRDDLAAYILSLRD